MAIHLRITITANNSGNYTVIGRCYFANSAGGTTPVSPASYFGSTNLYGAQFNFASVYLQNWVWHSTSLGVPFMGGIVCANEAEIPFDLFIKNTGDIANRSPNNFTVERSFDSGSTWETLKSFTDQINWAAGEERRFVLFNPTKLPTIIKTLQPSHHQIARLGL